MPLQKPLTVAFDWNGTLVNDTARACAATGVVLEHLGLRPLGQEEFQAGFRLPLRSWFADLGVPAGAVAEAIGEWNREMGDRPTELATGAREMITALRSSGIRLGVVSAASLDAVRRDLGRPALGGFAAELDFIVGDAAPKRAAFVTLAGSRLNDFVYVGDTEYDMLEARAAGVRAIGYAGGYRPGAALAAAGAEPVIDRLSELPSVLAEIRSDALVARSGGSR